MTATETEDYCVICKYVEDWESESVDTALTIVKKRGIGNICKISCESRKDGLHNVIKEKTSVKVHEKCRLRYIKTTIETEKCQKRKLTDCSENESSSDESEARSNEFDFGIHCIICTKKIHRTQPYSVLTDNETKQYVIDYHVNNEQLNPFICNEIVEKLLCVDDLSAVNAKYHRRNCSSKIRRAEKPKNETMLKQKTQRSMEEIFNFIDDSDENQFPIQDFKELLLTKEMFVPSNDTIWSKLYNHYQNNIVIINKKGAQGYCCLAKKGYDILKEKNEESKNDSSHYQLIDKVVKILFNEIKEFIPQDLNTYPASDTMFDEAKKIPDKLKYFLQKLILNQYRKEKHSDLYESSIISIAHAIMSAMFPRLMLSPLHIAVGVALHRKFGSRELIDMCHAMGFSCSYNEVRSYEISAAMQGEIELKEDAFVQFVSDNADWNVETLDGKGTFHSLGGCEIITPASYVMPKKPFPRLKLVSESDIAAQSKVDIQNYEFLPLEGLQFYCFPKPNVNLNLIMTDASKLNSFWMFLKYVQPTYEKGWNGYIENLTTINNDYEVSAINFLPFIHAYPSEYSTLLTAISQAISYARKFNMKTCILTFDQPLYLKSRDIIGASQMDADVQVVIRLGGFHTLLSFLGSIGFIMKDSGLVEVLMTIYGENTIKQIIVGHQYARALRAHSLVLFALVKKIYCRIAKKNAEFKKHMDYLQEFWFMLPTNMNEVLSDDIFQKVTADFERELDSLEKLNPTCKLWIQYCRMIFIVKDFLYAEKSANWELHLKTVERMIPFFHATGHFHYAKSAQLYLDDMVSLKTKMDSTEYLKFTTSGFWTARRSDRFFSGIFTDQTIEQTLMRLLKFQGGLFRRGVTESVAYQWIRGFIFTKDIIEGVEKFTKCSFDKNYQHKDSSDSRIKLDLKSLKFIEDFFEQYDPFCETNETLINIANGMTATDKCNCQNAFEEGLKIMKDITGKNFKDLKLSRSKIVKTIASSNSTITIDKNTVEIDPDVLFHRICVVKKTDEEMHDYLKWELSPFPQAYFNTYGMLKNTKSDLYSLFQKVNINVRDPIRTYFVIDGGFLIHKVKWILGQSFSHIMDNYIKYINKNYSSNCTVVFDGYESLTTKATERNRRAKQKASADVFFNATMQLKVNQDNFLLNTKNKINIITMLREKLSEVGIHSIQCVADADRTIVTTAINIAEDINKKVVVITEDTDVLVLVAALTPITSDVFVLKPARPNKAEELYSSKSLCHLPSVWENILFLHAFTGCDTVSATFYQGKTKFIKTFENNPDLAVHAQQFKYVGLSVENMLDHGCQLLLAMYNAPLTFRKPNIPQEFKPTNTQLVETYRYRMYLMTVTKNKKVNIGKIIPTVDAFRQHLKRTYLQVQNWLHGEILNPTDWGWEIVENCLIPTKMTQNPGPPSIMKLIFCSCKKDCGNSCSCIKNGLTCNLACKNCEGGNCTNNKKYTEEETFSLQNDGTEEEREEETSQM